MYNEFRIPHNVFEDEKFLKLTISAKLLYAVLCKLKNRHRNKTFFRSIKALAGDTGMYERTVMRAKKELSNAGFIRIERGHYQKSGWRGADFYEINGFQE